MNQDEQRGFHGGTWPDEEKENRKKNARCVILLRNGTAGSLSPIGHCAFLHANSMP
ncbi:hypothetical protein GWL_21360 [Herbaspirillum sp. GW103]|nr:hypothetical protein GWL_21360 [Herbaspirillum sp. GW103]